eukprot:gene10791-16939_t
MLSSALRPSVGVPVCGRKRVAGLQHASQISHAKGTKADFCLPTAVGLAGCAFQAYLEPVGADGFADYSLNDCRTVFTDRSDPNPNPYAVLSVNNSGVRSKVVNGKSSPIFKERFCLYIKNPEEDIVKIRLYSKSGFLDFSKDKDLGLHMLDLNDLMDGKVHELDLGLQGAGSNSESKVKVKCTLLKFEDFPEEVMEEMTTTDMDVPKDGGPIRESIPGVMNAVIKARTGELNQFESIAHKIGRRAAQAKRLMDGMTKLAGWEEADSEPPSPWKVLSEMASKEAMEYTPVAYVENTVTDTQVKRKDMATDASSMPVKRKDMATDASSMPVKWKDMATDLSFMPVSFDEERVDDNAGLPFTMRVLKALKPTDTISIHSGFLEAYDSVRQPIFKLIDSITGSGENGTWKVYVTGHSLGGALATVCAYELADRTSPYSKAQNIAMYSYGAPRVGNKLFAEKFDSMIPDSWRIMNPKDIIPTVPRLMGYTHVKHTVTVQRDDGGRDVFGEGQGGMEVIADLVEKLQEDSDKRSLIYDKILAKELAIFETLKDGTAIEEHLETFYLETLRRCVVAANLSSTNIVNKSAEEE